MKIEIYCASASRDNGKPTQMAGCGIVLVASDDHRQSKRRTMSFALSSSTVNLADIQVIRLALCSILPAYRKSKIILYTTSKYVADLLHYDGDVYAMNPTKNTKEVDDMRRLVRSHNDISLILECEECDDYIVAKRLAKYSLDSQNNTDSGTL